ncbi:InlB B-repeat-containing protein [Thermophilibacter sp.]|uniref:InlB B-repeat-containing protein n=1 Tax=Thermophilibacter sp. TaxID=2847309 RepID=UPI003A8D9BD1
MSPQGRGAKAIISGGVLESLDNAVVAGNGSNSETVYNGGTTIDISGGTLVGHIETSGYIACGVYHPQVGDLSISGDATILVDGGVGVLMRGGTLDMTGGSIVTRGTSTGGVGDTKVKVGCYGVCVEGKSGYYGASESDFGASISGGSITTDSIVLNIMNYQTAEHPGTIVVSGGTFSGPSTIEQYLEPGATIGQDGTVTPAPAVATVNGVEYKSLTAAIEAAQSGETVTLLQNLTVDEALTVAQDKDFTLDLGRFTLTLAGSTTYQDVESSTDDYPTALVNNGTVTVKNGTIDVTGETNGIVNLGSLTVDTTATIRCSSSAYHNYAVIQNFGGAVESAGTLESTANSGIITFGGTVEVTGGKISAPYGSGQNIGCALTIFNRAYNNESAGAKVTVSGGELESYGYAASTNNLYSGGSNPSSLTITGGTLTSHITSIYWPSAGTLTIGTEGSEAGPTITSTNGSGIEFCSGTLNVYGGTINGGAEHDESDSTPTDESLVVAYRNNSGSASAGDAITIITRRGAGYVTAPISVEIAGGTFTSAQNYGVRYFDCNVPEETGYLNQKVDVAISGGEFSGNLGAVNAEYVSPEDKSFISGGTFTVEPPQEYLADGFVSFERADGTFGVAPKEKVYTVTFMVDGKQFYQATTDADGMLDWNAVAKYAMENTPEDLQLDGWYTDAELTKVVDTTKPISGDVTLYGTWRIPVRLVTITFMVGDEVHQTVQIPADGTLANVTLNPDPVWEGHTFVGWYAQVNEDGTVVESSKIDLEKDSFGSDMILHAGFLPVEAEGDETTTKPEKDDGLAQTGDVTSFLPAVVAGAAGLTAAAGALTLRRRSK